MNILVNGAQAIEGRGSITITTRSDGPRVTITFADTGKGIRPEHLVKIFDPGFTTKGVGVGSGLGLAICYKIVKEHGGHITVDSDASRGTTFTIDLPITAPALVPPRKQEG
ncbi:MAG: sensor histidine kinase, partial [Acidobacteriota bacterium]